jgi:hypothetical protein
MNDYHRTHKDLEIQQKFEEWTDAASKSNGYPHKKPAKNFFGDSTALVPIGTLMARSHNANVKRQMRRSGSQRGS